MKELPPTAQAIVNAALEQDYGQATPVLLRRLAGALRAVIQECAVLECIYPDPKEKEVIIYVNDLFDIINQLEDHNGNPHH